MALVGAVRITVNSPFELRHRQCLKIENAGVIQSNNVLFTSARVNSDGHLRLLRISLQAEYSR